MNPLLKRLTLVAPRELEAALLAALLELEPALPGFTTVAVEGHGEGFVDASTHERVRGRIDRLLLWLVLPADGVQRVLARLELRLPHSQLVWWVEPVDAMGRLA